MYPEDKLPDEFKLYLPVPAQKSKPSTTQQLQGSNNNISNNNNSYSNGNFSSSNDQQQYQQQTEEEEDPSEVIAQEGQSDGPEQEPEDRDDKPGDE